jgi:chromosome partitioning protein
MGTVVTVMNMKGGVGKTTVAMHVGGMAARRLPHERKVLILDYDPQFNLSQAFLPPKTYFSLEKERKTTIAILLDDDSDLNPYQLQVPGNHQPPNVNELVAEIYTYKAGGCLHVVPSTLDLMYVALGQSGTSVKPIEERFEKFIAECKSIYDLVIIDCHPAGSLFTRTALSNSDHVVIPVVPQRYAVRGIGLMMKFIDAKKADTKGPKPHILFNCTARIGTSPEENEIRTDPVFTAHCLTNTLKYFKAFSDPEGGLGFVWSSGKPYSDTAYRNLSAVTTELLTRIGA